MADDFFFEDETVQEIAEAHISKIVSLEDREARRIMKLYRNIRHELRDRLEILDSGSFTAQRIRGALAQVELALDAMKTMLAGEMKTSGMGAAETGVQDLIVELNKWNKEFTGAVVPLNLDALVVATDVSNFLFERHQASLDAYSSALRSQFAQVITEGSVEQISMGEMVSRIGRAFLGEEWKLHRLVRTELHNVYSQGKLTGMRDLQENNIPDLKKTLFHPMDARTGKDSKRLNANNPIVPIDEPFVESSTGKTLTYMAPPNRPNDRAILIPFRDSWQRR